MEKSPKGHPHPRGLPAYNLAAQHQGCMSTHGSERCCPQCMQDHRHRSSGVIKDACPCTAYSAAQRSWYNLQDHWLCDSRTTPVSSIRSCTTKSRMLRPHPSEKAHSASSLACRRLSAALHDCRAPPCPAARPHPPGPRALPIVLAPSPLPAMTACLPGAAPGRFSLPRAPIPPCRPPADRSAPCRCRCCRCRCRLLSRCRRSHVSARRSLSGSTGLRAASTSSRSSRAFSTSSCVWVGDRARGMHSRRLAMRAVRVPDQCM